MYKEKNISATNLARNLSSAVEQVRLTGKSLNVKKGNKTIAILSPPPAIGISVDELIELLESLPAVNEKDDTLKKDMDTIRNSSNIPESPWA